MACVLSGVPGERRGSRDWREHGAGRLDEGRHRPLGDETATRYSVPSGLMTYVMAVSDDATTMSDDVVVVFNVVTAGPDDATAVSNDATAVSDDATAVSDDATAVSDDVKVVLQALRRPTSVTSCCSPWASSVPRRPCSNSSTLRKTQGQTSAHRVECTPPACLVSTLREVSARDVMSAW